MGGCQNYGPFLGTLNIRCRIIIGTQKGTIILTTTHVDLVTWRMMRITGVGTLASEGNTCYPDSNQRWRADRKDVKSGSK